MAHFLDHYSRFILYFGQTPFILSFLILGYIWFDRVLFFRAFILVLSSMILNISLKLGFKIPLKPHLGLGYAFPSGHMQSSMVLHTWFMMHSPSRMGIVLSLFILSSLSFSLDFCQYHDHKDIFGGMIAGLIWVCAFLFLMRKSPSGALILGLSTLLIIGIFFQSPTPAMVQHSLLVYFMMAGFVMAQNFFSESIPLSFFQKIMLTLILLSCGLLFQKIFNPYSLLKSVSLLSIVSLVTGSMIPTALHCARFLPI